MESKVEWMPIEQYDGMKLKPDNCAFYFKAHKSRMMTLAGIVRSDRLFGQRECTHYIILPAAPEKSA